MRRQTDRFISGDAIDLIQRMLSPKEFRLCSQQYMLNDYAHSKSEFGAVFPSPSNKDSRNYQGYYVFPNDATNIKTHRFFRKIRWEEIPYRRPPFVPKVKSWEDTRYFDEGEPISDVNDGSSEVIALGSAPPEGDSEDRNADPRQVKAISANGPSDAARNGVFGQAGNRPASKPAKKKKKEKKRPRDKILRDRTTAKTALEMRKKSAFSGYSYRRPKSVLAALELERGRQLVAGMDGAGRSTNARL
jgi:hypothetical protein